MAGPVDCRVNPTGVNELATSKPISWFEQNLIAHVPPPHAGFMRRVYPGFSESYYGFGSFSDLLEDLKAKGWVDLEYDDSRGNYKVRAKKRKKQGPAEKTSADRG